MPSALAWLLESETGPAGAYPPDYTAYRLIIGDDGAGWLTGIRNLTIGTLWFPRFGRTAYDVHDPSTVVKVESFTAMSPEDIAAVYGSPIPVLPIEIVALSDYVNPHSGDDGTDSEGDEPDDVSEGAVPPDLVYMQVEVEYLLAWQVDFTLAIQAAGSTRWHRDECGHHYLLTGDQITLGAVASNVQADGAVSATTYRWRVTGAEVVAGTPDVVGNDKSLVLSATSRGSVSVSVDVTVTTQVGQGIQVVAEAGTRSATYQFEVLTPDEAAVVSALCRLLKETLPIRRLVFPGDPAKHRYSRDDRRLLRSAAGRLGTASAALIQRVNEIVARDMGELDEGRLT